jgi:hypothetical protein
MSVRKWTLEQLQSIAGQTVLDIMEDMQILGRENVDPLEWTVATCDVENIHDEDRKVFFNLMGFTG